MKDIKFTKSAGIPPVSMAEEFLSHKKGSEWWYAIGSFKDEAGKQYSYMFTLANITAAGVRMHMLIMALTDVEGKKHYFNQYPIFFGSNVTITPERVGWKDVGFINFTEKQWKLNMNAKEFSLNLTLDVVKPPIWQCDKGVCRMGLPDRYTYLFSYTNLNASGKLTIGTEEHKVSGKGWFDKQGGNYKTNRYTEWEYWACQFFDGEEIMLISYPQSDYHDGTYIKKSGNYRRLNDYKIEPLGFTQAGGKKFSYGWKVEMKGVKDEQYTIEPTMDGQMNLFYCEMLAVIKDKNGKIVGNCEVELMPGPYNEGASFVSAFKRVKE
jgi:predicted secreted hydrolase